MNTNDLIEAVREDTGMTHRQVAMVVRAATRRIAAELAAGQRVYLSNLGRLYPIRIRGRSYVNQWGVTEHPERTKIRFQAARSLHDAIVEHEEMAWSSR